MSPYVAASIRPPGLSESIRLVITGGEREPLPPRARTELAVLGVVEEALETSAGRRSLVRAHERKHGSARARVVAGLTLSVASLDGYVAAVAAPADAMVGISLEQDGRIGPAYDRFFLTSAERRAATSVGRTVVWTLKEAAWKALVRADSPVPPGLELFFDPSGAIRLATIHGHGVSLRSVIVAPWAGYVLAIVWTDVGRQSRPRLRPKSRD